MKHLVQFALAVVLVWAVTGSPALASDPDYLVGPGDVLKVTVYDHEDLSSTLRISSSGSIQFPLIGKLSIAGQTVSQVGDTIAGALADGYIVNPQVSVFIEEFRSRRVTVMGQVAQPGLQELSGPTTLLELISKAGGLTKEAGDIATIHRKDDDGQEKVFQVNLKRLLEDGDGSLDIVLANEDNIFIAPAGMVYVTGEVRSPDSYKIDEGLTVIMAITKAGGFTNLAAKGRVKIIRKVDGEEEIYEKVPMNTLVLEDDVIVVPESFF